jgi:hypothetical protein
MMAVMVKHLKKVFLRKSVHYVSVFQTTIAAKEEFTSLKQFCLTQGDNPWNPSSFSDQVADKFYKQVVDTESCNANNLKCSPYDPSDTHKNGLNG